MKWCVVVLAVGNISYEKHSRRVLTHYFDKHNVDYHFITEAPVGLDMRNAHPSWWKLLAHRICPGYDFILCWDLDLLPRTPNVSVFQSFDMTKLCLAWDSHALHHPHDRFLPSFKYNGGLIGYPVGARGFLEGVFEKYAPGTYPSYEQYYLNDEIASNQYEIHELDKDLNVLFSFSEFPQARLQHYTYTNDAKKYIAGHVDKYFCTDDWILQKVSPYTMVSRERLLSNLSAVRHVELNGIKGDVVEIGVWKGGSTLSMVLAYDWTNKTERTFHLYDTFEGMTKRGDHDVTYTGHTVSDGEYSCGLSVTRDTLKNTEYPQDKIKFYKGDILRNTFVPETIAILRLDTDYYDSTLHELRTFYDRVASGGMVLIDDYGHWNGCKRAVDEWLLDHPEIRFERSDYTGIFFVKP